MLLNLDLHLVEVVSWTFCNFPFWTVWREVYHRYVVKLSKIYPACHKSAQTLPKIILNCYFKFSFEFIDSVTCTRFEIVKHHYIIHINYEKYKLTIFSIPRVDCRLGALQRRQTLCCFPFCANSSGWLIQIVSFRCLSIKVFLTSRRLCFQAWITDNTMKKQPKENLETSESASAKSTPSICINPFATSRAFVLTTFL